jgi:hypothetical protein
MNGGPNAFNSYIWVIDAHPEDINTVDYVKPDGRKVMRTIADFRQLNDALFHAGLDSGSSYEWEDAPNRLHFYVVDLRKDANGILCYTLGIKSLDGAGTQARGAELSGPAKAAAAAPDTPVAFMLKNTGRAAGIDPSVHPSGAGSYLNSDIYRLSVSVEGQGWSVRILNGLAAVAAGSSRQITVYATPDAGSSASAKVTLKAVSESDPTKIAAATVSIAKR